jgi:hypothetical protein
MRTLEQVAALGGRGHNTKPDLLKKTDKEKVRILDNDAEGGHTLYLAQLLDEFQL